MRRLLPFILLFIGLILIVCSPMLLRMDRWRNQLSAHLTQKFQRPVVIGKMEGGLFPPAIKLRDVGILDRNSDTPLLQANQVVAPISWMALFKGQIASQAVHLKGWTATIYRNADGTWAWQEWLAPAAAEGEKTGGPVNDISFDRGEFHFVDPYGPGPSEFVVQVLQGNWDRKKGYTSIKGVLTSLPSPVNFLFQGSGKFVNAPEWSGMLDLTQDTHQWKLECKVGGGRFDASGQADQWRFDSLYAFLRYYSRLPFPPPVTSPGSVLQGWQSRFDWQGSTLTVRQTATIAGGKAEFNVGVFFAPRALPIAKADLALDNVRIQAIQSAFWGTAPLEGLATGLTHFEATFSSHPWSSVHGDGALNIKDGKYYLPDVSTRALAKAKTMRYLQKKYPGFLGGGLPYTQAKAKWQIHRGTLFLEEAFSDLGDMRIAATGTYDTARRGLDAFVRVQIREKNPALLKELPPNYIYKGAGTSQIQPMNGKIQGTPSQWQLRAVRGSKVPAATANKLNKALRSK
jgi:hypothetical protein